MASHRVAVVGSLNADLIVQTPRLPRPGETVTGSDLVVAPGGKSANQAAAAALVGADVVMVGRVGADEHGELLLGRLARAGVDTSHVARLEDVPTGTALIAVDENGENTIIVSPAANGRLTPQDVTGVAGAFDDAALLCLCLEVSLETVTAAARAAAERDVQVVLNLSPSQQLPADLLGLVDVLVVNAHELADLVGADVVGDGAEPDWEAVRPAMAELGPSRLVVTLGAAGACALEVGVPDVVCRPAPPVEPVDTTGCGDAFLGSLCARLAAGDDLGDAVAFAVRVGAYAATGPGAQDSYPTLAELQSSGL